MGEIASASVPAQAPSTLAMLVAELERNNPDIRAARRDVDASIARIAPAGAPPDPTLSVGYMGGSAEAAVLSVGECIGQLQAVWLVTGDSVSGQAGIAVTRRRRPKPTPSAGTTRTTRRRVIAELKTAYVEFRYLSRSLEILERNKERLEQFRQIAEARFSVGQGVQQDVLKAQVEISLILERQALFEPAAGHGAGAGSTACSFGHRIPRSIDAELRRHAADAVRSRTCAPVCEQNYPALKRDERSSIAVSRRCRSREETCCQTSRSTSPVRSSWATCRGCTAST